MFDTEFFSVLGLLLHSVLATFYITLSCFITAFTLGLGVAVLRRLSGRRFGTALSLVVFVARATPVLVLLFLFYFSLPSIGVHPSPLIAINLSLGVISGAYISEVFRGALSSAEHSEIVAAQAMGFSSFQLVRYIELPQMLRFSFPSLMNELTTILKNTTFAYAFGMNKILGQAKALTASTMLGMDIYLVAGILYFLIYQFISFVLVRVRSCRADD